MALFERVPVLIRGGGDLASGVAYRLVRAGFPVLITELDKPLLVRPGVSYGAAVFSGTVTVEGITARLSPSADLVTPIPDDSIPVVIDPDGDLIRRFKPPVVVDGRMAKVNLSTTINDAPLVVALGPGFMAGVDCHAVIETNRGHDLGRVIRQGSAEPDTAAPGSVNGRGGERVLRAPKAGHVTRQQPVGSLIQAGQSVAFMDDEPLVAPFDGVLRGLIHESVWVTPGLKIGDLDPRARPEHAFTISDKALAVGGGVVEAVLSAPQIRSVLMHRIGE